MADEISYWVCSCGKANLNDVKTCASCGKRKPWRQFFVYAAVGALLCAIIIPLSISPVSKIEKSNPQIAFEEVVRSTARDFGRAPNAVAQHDLITKRDTDLSSSVSAWIGTVRSVSLMTNGAALEVAIGDATFVAGVWIGAKLDTVIRPTSSLYSVAIDLKAGDMVRISGIIQKHAGHLAEISYSDNGSAMSPRYIFDYTSIGKLAGK